MADSPSSPQYATQTQATGGGNENEIVVPESASFTTNLKLLRHSQSGAVQRKANAAQHLSRLIGNQALQQVLNRVPISQPPTTLTPATSQSPSSGGTSSRPTDLTRPSSGIPTQADATASPMPAEIPETPIPADMQAFLARGVLPGPNGREFAIDSGGFNARFDPAERRLIITVNIGFTLRDALRVDAQGHVSVNRTGLSHSTIQALTAVATSLNQELASGFFTVEDVTTVVTRDYQWGANEQMGWLAQYQQDVQNAWSGQHYFVSQDWSQLTAGVRVAVNVHLGHQRGDHTRATVVKSDSGNITSAVSGGRSDRSRDQRVLLSSSDINTGEHTGLSQLSQHVTFADNSADVSGAASFLDSIIATFATAAGRTGDPIEIVGRAGPDEDPARALELSQQRAEAVRQYLVTHGPPAMASRIRTRFEGASGEVASAEAEVVVGSGERQHTANHEFGHMIGLGDEYATGRNSMVRGTGHRVGSRVSHTDVNHNRLGDRQIDGAVSENNDGIMSLGNSVRPQHYSTFHHALQTVTGRQWEYGGEGEGRMGTPVAPGTQIPGGVLT